MRWGVALLLVAACGRFGFDPTQVCVDGVCSNGDDAGGRGDAVDAPSILIDGAPGVDTDGDSFNDDVDNCIFIANPTQHDEDTDSRGDVCDNCPTLANNDQANVGEVNAGQTADSVGDVCDPRPTQPGESILFFEPFTGAALASDWTVINGTWVIGNDVVAQNTLVSDQRIHDLAFTGGADYIVEARFTFSALDTGNVNAGIIHRMSNDNGWLCAVFRDDTIMPVASLLMIWSLQNGAANFERNRATIAEPKPGDTFRLLAGGFGSNLYCALDSLQTGPSAPFTSNQNASGVPGMRTNRTSGAYSTFIVYGLGGPI
ncbi:MAG TPA: thrombospondin type 3 repeat-containing protein [Kofleriaceae bacterium]